MNRVTVIGPHIPPIMCTVECTLADEAEVRRRMEKEGWRVIVTDLRRDSASFTFSRGDPELLNGLHCQLRELLL